VHLTLDASLSMSVSDHKVTPATRNYSWTNS